jgi:hypothetical protein
MIRERASLREDVFPARILSHSSSYAEPVLLRKDNATDLFRVMDGSSFL